MIPPKEKLEDIVKELQRIMRIQDWDISCSIITGLEMQRIVGHDEAAMHVNCYRQLNKAYISINNEHPKIIESEEYVYAALVHEIIHVIQEEMAVQIDTIECFLPDDYRGTMKSLTLQKIENAVERLARAFVNALPYHEFKKLLST